MIITKAKCVVFGNEGRAIPKGVGVNLSKRDTSIHELSDIEEEVLNFTGIIIEDKQIFVSFPKQYIPSDTDITEDIDLLFTTLMRHKKENQDLYINKSINFKTNFPFNAFFEIYNYYTKYGIYKEDNTKIQTGYNGKVAWKHTIKNSSKVIGQNGLVFLPLQIKSIDRKETLLSEFMLYAIDYTLELFYTFWKRPLVNGYILQKKYIYNKSYVLENLYLIEKKLFKDIHKRLVHSLIDFFRAVTAGGQYFFKHYSFSSVWEDMINKYLNYNFIGEYNKKLYFKPSAQKRNNFKKAVFHPNLVNKNQNIQPDCYLVDNENQYIFDAKYYNEINGINYKQIVYYFCLKNYRTESSKYTQTINALILPGHNRQQIHFQFDPIYNNEESGFYIIECYLNIKSVMKLYISL